MSEAAAVFGASGLLGMEVCRILEKDGVAVVPVTRGAHPAGAWVSMQNPEWVTSLEPGALTRVVWAQGMNASGSILDNGPAQLGALLEANVGFIVSTLRELLDRRALAEGARLVVVSSIWQETARENKLAYVTSKSALAGLVRSLVADLAPLGYSVNAVLPGVVDGPMTRAFLTEADVAAIEMSTPQRSLVTATDVANACVWLTSGRSRGVNGQFLTVDGGWSSVRHV